MSKLTKAVEDIKPTIAAELGSMTAFRRRKKIAAMCKKAGQDAEAVRAKLSRRGEQDEAVWQAEIAKAEAPYFAALELFRDDAPDARDE